MPGCEVKPSASQPLAQFPEYLVPFRSHQGEREKNELPIRRCQGCEDSRQHEKRLFHEGTKFFLVRIVNQRHKEPSKVIERRFDLTLIRKLEAIMDPKWNTIVDNIAIRIGMVVVGFGVWLAVSYGLLSA